MPMCIPNSHTLQYINYEKLMHGYHVSFIFLVTKVIHSKILAVSYYTIFYPSAWADQMKKQDYMVVKARVITTLLPRRQIVHSTQ